MEDILIEIMDYRPTPKKEDFDDDDDDDDDDDVTAPTGATVTPPTSASSSPSLPSTSSPSTPPPTMMMMMMAAIAPRSIRLGGLGRLASVPASSSSSSCLWRIPASRKSLRTRNPIRAIVDPIMAAEMARSDMIDGDDDKSTTTTTTAGKDQISLAVSGVYLSSLSHSLAYPSRSGVTIVPLLPSSHVSHSSVFRELLK